MSNPPPPPPPSSLPEKSRDVSHDLQLDEAEEGLIRSMERRRSRSRTASGDHWTSAVEGERPPLDTNVSFDKVYHAMGASERSVGSSGGEATSPTSGQAYRKRFREIARKARLAQALTASPNQGHKSETASSSESVSSLGSGEEQKPDYRARHRRHISQAAMLLQSIQEDAGDNSSALISSTVGSKSAPIFEGVAESNLVAGESAFSIEASDTDRLVTGALKIEGLFHEDESEEEKKTDNEARHDDIDIKEGSGEKLPLLDRDDSNYATLPSAFTGRFSALNRKTVPRPWRRVRKYLRMCCYPVEALKSFRDLLLTSYAITLGLPCFFVSLWLFNVMGNPYLDFLPGQASLAWWLNFVCRQCVTLDIARIIQWLAIDKFLLGTRAGVKIFGPLLSLTLIQSKGYPFLLIAWGINNLFLLHGDQPFDRHWLYYAVHAKYFQQVNSGNYILASDRYLRLLISMIIAGGVKACKRTAAALYFGRRTLAEFKPRMERILKDIVLLTEVAALAEDIDLVVTSTGAAASEVDAMDQSNRKIIIADQVTWDFAWDNKAMCTGASADLVVADEDSNDRLQEEDHMLRNISKSERSNDVRELLDHWTEPSNRRDKMTNASIDDILKFRRALTFMDESQPFGPSFGAASSRGEFLDSAERVYRRLLKAAPEQDRLGTEVLDLLVEDEEGKIFDQAKRATLHKLFRPNAANELSLLAFLQSCDAIYKRLRFFRASVANASVIDHALESILNGLVNLLLILVLLCVLRFNPWPLLVSVSTILVSISFAVSSSCSNYIEGVLLICLHRPFDLGDRIYMQNPSVLECSQGIGQSWFIEDINLFYTTVRYAGTNEIGTINNGSISKMRIVNGNRSPNALVYFQFPFHISALDNDRAKLKVLMKRLDQYAKDYPRRWRSFAYLLINKFEIEKEQISAIIAFHNRKSWQDLTAILFDKSDLVGYVYDTSRQLGICYDELPSRKLLYYAGDLKTGKVFDYRKDLHAAENICDRNTAENISERSTEHTNLDAEVADGNLNQADHTFLAQLRASHL